MIAVVVCGVAVWVLFGAAVSAWMLALRRLERIARAVHELRGPMTAARLALHTAGRERGWVGLAPVDHELARAAIALDDLEAARCGRPPRVVAEAVDAHDLLEQVLASWAPLAWPTGRGLRIDEPLLGFGTGPLVVRGDRARLAQALGNLVGNALEHGTGTVVLRVRAGTGGRVCFEVQDAGPGLPASVSALARRRRAGRGSRGRGLAIATEAARRHGGTVRDERIAGGCRLVLELPGESVTRTAQIADDAGAHDAGPAAPAPAAPIDPAEILAGLRTAGVARPAPRRSLR